MTESLRTASDVTAAYEAGLVSESALYELALLHALQCAEGCVWVYRTELPAPPTPDTFETL